MVLQLEEVPGLAERMASLMCVDIDLTPDAEEQDNSAGVSDENGCKKNVLEIVESEICTAKQRGDDTVRWLELEELDMDDAMLLSLDLPSKFPVSHFYYAFYYLSCMEECIFLLRAFLMIAVFEELCMCSSSRLEISLVRIVEDFWR